MPTEVSIATTLSPARKQEAQDPVFLRIRDLVYQTCGIYHSDEKLYLLVAACQRRMAADTAKASDTKGYLALLTGASSKEWETRELLNEITIGETCLFRSQPQINALKNVILPELLTERTRMGLKKLKIWSAGCSTGEEPHTLSILFLEEKEKLLRDWSFEIQATDLNDRSIEAARTGVYGEYALRNTPEIYKRKYFTPVENGKLQVKDEVKARITFTRLNLTDEQINLSTQENALVGVDPAVAATNFSQAQVAEQATLSATAKVLSLPTLLDFLR
jgi:chemotaxis protein methyltransferase CheR